MQQMTTGNQMRTYSVSCGVNVGKEGHMAVVKGLSTLCLQPVELQRVSHASQFSSRLNQKTTVKQKSRKVQVLLNAVFLSKTGRRSLFYCAVVPCGRNKHAKSDQVTVKIKSCSKLAVTFALVWPI